MFTHDGAFVCHVADEGHGFLNPKGLDLSPDLTIFVSSGHLKACEVKRKSHDSGNSDSRKTGDRKQGDRPLPKPLGREVKLCKALVNGNITNDNQTFENVFIAVNTTCTELLDFLVAQNDSVPEDTTGETSQDLVAIVEKFESPCTTACEIAGGVDCAPLVDGGAQ
ncbi:hypothetical protein MAR_019097 [Mya arenaria]|uniref:Uncharacterized protein n=1 Tax=Mya arenaria TaxID=6604 RepID=A0ABY7EL87_MYAAR|nr:hypothetical protein MAR_019097 [Mya arenaria]